jgi:hypothetical protein
MMRLAGSALQQHKVCRIVRLRDTSPAQHCQILFSDIALQLNYFLIVFYFILFNSVINALFFYTYYYFNVAVECNYLPYTTVLH